MAVGAVVIPKCFSSSFNFVLTNRLRKCFIHSISQPPKSKEELLVVVGGGAAGVYGAIHAKTVAPHLGVVIIEQGKPLTKVKVSGGGRCNVTNGHCADNMILAENYPRGHKEFRGPFFNTHGPVDTMSWFASHGVELKIEDDGRVFPVSNSSSSIIDCLMSEVKKRGGLFGLNDEQRIESGTQNFEHRASSTEQHVELCAVVSIGLLVPGNIREGDLADRDNDDRFCVWVTMQSSGRVAIQS
ncbi:hypothetical protein Lal_00005930 [Lupinus albus]|nr:hypothetical protein Lal_00005930 [Lupinus albus]